MTEAHPPGNRSDVITDVAHWVWDTKYRLRRGQRAERDLDATWQRVARAIAVAEPPAERAAWRERFHTLLAGGGFLPGGRIIAGAGSGRRVTLCNCFVMGPIEDSVDGILRSLREGALTMHQGGGVGYDFSTLRPRGTPARGSGATASGPVSFMEVWDATCRTLLSTNPRRGAMMATLRCDHPDIELFINAKRETGALSNFNLSVLVTDDFMRAVRDDGDWWLRFPDPRQQPAPSVEPTRRRVRARVLWNAILTAAHESAEPGVLFIDRINAENNLHWCEHITATNPCGEIPLPAYGSCNLGSLDVTAFVRSPFDPAARFDHEALAGAARDAVRFLDNVLEVTRFPLRKQAARARATRRVGLGLTGLADGLLMLGHTYGSEASCEAAAGAMRTICHAAYEASVELARERGPFPAFQVEPYLAAPFVSRLPPRIRDGIARHGIRNSHLTAIAPAGSISLLAGGVSSGIEPIFAESYHRRVMDAAGEPHLLEITDPAMARWRQRSASGPLEGYIEAADVAPGSQLAMQAALQRHVDSAISKTVTVAPDTPFEQFARIYDSAYALGVKGCTVYRRTTVRGTVLDVSGECSGAPHCCSLEREVD